MIRDNRYITLGEIMKRVNAELLVRLSWSIGSLTAVLGTDFSVFKETANPELYCQQALEYYQNMETVCNDAGLDYSVNTIKRIINLLKNSDVIKGYELKQFVEQVKSLNERIQDEMENSIYFAVLADKKQFITTANLFGEEVSLAFPSVTIDIEEAGKCLAFERWTASVFHLMRVMEVGIRVLGDILKLPVSTNRTWDAILKKCDDESKKPFEQKSPEWKKDEKFFAEAAAMLRSVKVAWRNPTMHVERVYTEEQAQDIWNAVKGFMRQLSTNLKEDRVNE